MQKTPGLENRRAQLLAHENLPLEASQWAKPATGGTHTQTITPALALDAEGQTQPTGPQRILAAATTPDCHANKCRHATAAPGAREWFKQRAHTENKTGKPQ